MILAVIVLGFVLAFSILTHVLLQRTYRSFVKDITATLVAAQEQLHTQNEGIAQIAATIGPLLVQTAWLGPQPYGTNLEVLQKLEDERNRQIVAVRKILTDLPVVTDLLKGIL
jgi:hypothetical protein